ncbi:MAG TPA: response regulator [Planctomycetota bacterium]|nr:response regulator [Planctomycetota bacterium]
MERPDSSREIHRHHVVVSIDDEPEVLRSLQRLLRREPYEFLTTEKPDQALDWILQKHASMIIADQRMPSMSGLDLLEIVRHCSPSTVRVMLTAHSELTGIMKIKKIDAIQRLLRKPWDSEELKHCLRELLQEQELSVKGDDLPLAQGN